ncbi:McrB family protein [Metapseudomonas otitidis]|uniref:McrB family protein n=1 Tax=Metapseudomonas otitidis TaxID=319939 RepID=UPI001F39C155|nr:AAA family ATPase [Pseudomonas otitidis]
MKILYGPPGTGKTWQAMREAVKATDPALFAQALADESPEEALKRVHDNLVADGRILWVTFHPSYSYEDFVEGFRPVLNDKDQLSYKVVDGPFKMLCQRAKLAGDIALGTVLKDGSNREAGEVVRKDAEGWVVRVKPNRSDEIAEHIDKFVPRYVVSKILAKKLPAKIFSIPGSALVKLEEYGIDPKDSRLPPPRTELKETESTRVGSLVRRIVAADTEILSSSDLSNSAHIGSVIRELLRLEEQGTHVPTSVTMVIDEINRAESSRVFGELLTLLEANKREGMPEEKQAWLPYSKSPFTVPPTVSIIGTMNTVDRSLTALDFAMRRRFDFILVPADSEKVPVSYGGIAARDFLNRINNRVTSLMGSGYEFGHAFLMEHRLEEVRSLMSWSNDTDGQAKVFAHVLRTNILPTLAEYLHNDWGKVKAIAGITQDESLTISLFESIKPDQKFLERLEEEFELSENRSLSYSHWWDPTSQAWDTPLFQRFANSLAKGL